MKKTDLAYIGGFLDGEGCICLTRFGNKRQYIRLDVQVVQANEWVIQWLKYSFGGFVCKVKSYKLHHKQRWAWKISSREALAFLKVILPYLKLKRGEAELAIKFQESRRGRGNRVTGAEKVLEEADRILMSKLKDKSV